MNINVQARHETVSIAEFARRHPGVDGDLLRGFISRHEADLYRNGSIRWTDSTPPIVLVDEKRFFDHLLCVT